jgi:hypothetical protein
MRQLKGQAKTQRICVYESSDFGWWIWNQDF